MWQAPTSDWYSVVVYQWGNLIAGDDIRYTLHLQADAPTPTPTPWVTYTLGDRASCEGIGGASDRIDRRCQFFQWTQRLRRRWKLPKTVTLQIQFGDESRQFDCTRLTRLSYTDDGVIANYGRMTVGTDPLANNADRCHNYGVIINTSASATAARWIITASAGSSTRQSMRSRSSTRLAMRPAVRRPRPWNSTPLRRHRGLPAQHRRVRS